MNVCFLVGTLGRGGAERQLLYMLDALRLNGTKVRVLCLTKGEFYEQQIRNKEIEVEWIGKSRSRLVRMADIVKNLRKNQPNILQSSHFYTNIYVGFAGKILRIPSIGAIRSDLDSEIRRHGILGNLQMTLPGFLIANSRIAFQRAINKGIKPDRIEFVRNVVGSAELACGHKVKGKGLTIIFVGRLDEKKRPGDFLKLAAILRESFSELDLRFQIAGDGVLRQKLEREAIDLNLGPDSLQFLGNCSDMGELYAGADILISTSALEGTSNVILEAMSFGIPVIATRVGGTPDIVDESRGILVEPGNIESLVAAASSLIESDEDRKSLGLAGRDYVKQNHSIENLGNHLKRIYNSLTL